MSAHFSETDLLEIHYLEREKEQPVAEHFAQCERCAGQFDTVKERLREVAALPAPDDRFFERQREAVMDRVRLGRRAARPWRFAAAAALVLAISGVAVHRSVEKSATPVTATHAMTTAAAAAPETAVPRDVWDTDALTEFHPLVDWQSWEESKGSNGGRS